MSSLETFRSQTGLKSPHSLAALCGALILTAVAAALWLNSTTEPAVLGELSPASQPSRERIEPSVPDWVETLHHGTTEVEFRRVAVGSSDPASGTTLASLRGTGPLSAEAVAQLRGTFTDVEKLWREQLEQCQREFEKDGDWEKQVEFAKRLVAVEEGAAAPSALSAASYYTAESDAYVPLVDGVRCLGTGVESNGEYRSVTVVLEVARYPGLANALEYLKESERMARSLAMAEFNGKPAAQRRILIDRWRTAAKQGTPPVGEVGRYFRPGLVVTKGDLLTPRGR